MKLIIDIDDKVYNDLKNRGLTGMLTSKECECMNESIYNGTPFEEELEKIKYEMILQRDSVDLFQSAFDWNIELIEKHITEIKGE